MMSAGVKKTLQADVVITGAGVIPEDFGQPPVVTIVALAKRLANHLAAAVEAKVLVQPEGTMYRPCARITSKS
jgi:choline dehydrogenase-like flavoprotein